MTKRGSDWFSTTADSHWRLYRKRLKACRKQHTEDAVHKLRIATRRLLALVDLLRQLAPQAGLRKLRNSLKNQLDGFDELRDTQVMRLEIETRVGQLPELTEFMHHLHIEEQRLLMQSPVFIASLPSGKLRRKLSKAIRACRQQQDGDELADRIAAALDSLYQTALARFHAADPAQLATLHKLRIALKKLRYSIMLAEPLLPPLPEDHLTRMQRHLTRLGDIQNAAVLTDHLKHFGNDESAANYYTQHLRDLITDYQTHQGEITAFWRASPEQIFPWRN